MPPRLPTIRSCRSICAGERSLGGALSWSEPQPLALWREEPLCRTAETGWRDRDAAGAGEPSPTLAEHTWASLADGTPLVTARKLDAGQIVLFHTSADTSWSNLALSGHFVEMLRRITQLSRGHGGAAPERPKRWLPSACSTPMAF